MKKKNDELEPWNVEGAHEAMLTEIKKLPLEYQPSMLAAYNEVIQVHLDASNKTLNAIRKHLFGLGLEQGEQDD